jgi:hypothetical protein
MVAAGAASTVVVVDSAAEDTSAAELRARAMEEEARVPQPLELFGAEALRVPMEPTDRRDPAEPTDRRDRVLTVVGRMAARLTVRDIQARMVAGLRPRQQVHVMVQLLIAAQTQRQPRAIMALPALPPIEAPPEGTPRRRPTVETLRLQHPIPLAGWSLPVDQVLL